MHQATLTSKLSGRVQRTCARYSLTYASAFLKITFLLSLASFLATAAFSVFSRAHFSSRWRFFRSDSGTTAFAFAAGAFAFAAGALAFGAMVANVRQRREEVVNCVHVLICLGQPLRNQVQVVCPWLCRGARMHGSWRLPRLRRGLSHRAYVHDQCISFASPCSPEDVQVAIKF